MPVLPCGSRPSVSSSRRADVARVNDSELRQVRQIGRAIRTVPRRVFLSSAAAPIAAGLLQACRRRSRPDDPIVIVGAGLAGLRAASLLIESGRPVVVLEARSSPGGRVRTVRSAFSDDLYAEAGPFRISHAHRRVLELVSEHRLSLTPVTAPTGSAVVTIGSLTLRSPAEIAKAAAPLRLTSQEAGLTQAQLLNKYVGDLAPAFGDPAPTAETLDRWRPDDQLAWPEWLRRRGASDGAITLMTLGGDSRELSALYVLRQIALMRSSDQFFKIEGGMDRLTRALAIKVGDRLRYDAAVVQVNHDAAGASVTYLQRDRTTVVRASRVVFAIPFSTLRRIALEPACSPEKARIIVELPYFPATRFLLQSRTRFWEQEKLSGSARTDDPAEIWDAAYEQLADAGVLAATAGGTVGRTLATASDAEALAFGVRLIGRTFPGMRAEFRQGAVVRWANEPWARGAFAVFHPGQMTAWLAEIPRAEGRLHFAGEHTSPWMGWMEGALESAERVSREVLASSH